ncbi:hypothetical protein ACFYVR_13245 [Rhodococcus sp. NPDC003318]|uniref:hypothetical protein n=1 Tax=Rhodococcus sp. NPDC003318 TaxID=3364503 RepID=UPI003685CD54
MSGRRLRTAILGINYEPESTGIAPYTTGLAVGLAEHGHDVEVLTGYLHHPQWHPRAVGIPGALFAARLQARKQPVLVLLVMPSTYRCGFTVFIHTPGDVSPVAATARPDAELVDVTVTAGTAADAFQYATASVTEYAARVLASVSGSALPRAEGGVVATSAVSPGHSPSATAVTLATAAREHGDTVVLVDFDLDSADLGRSRDLCRLRDHLTPGGGGESPRATPSESIRSNEVGTVTYLPPPAHPHETGDIPEQSDHVCAIGRQGQEGA